MNGVEILNTVTDMPDKSAGMIVMYVMFAVISIILSGICVWSIKEMVEDVYMDWKGWIGVAVLILISAGFCVGDFFLIRGIVDEARTRETIVYATIDDTVPWTEINEKYELIRQDGKIYQLRVREDGGV
jgi:hypothetical protein